MGKSSEVNEQYQDKLTQAEGSDNEVIQSWGTVSLNNGHEDSLYCKSGIVIFAVILICMHICIYKHIKIKLNTGYFLL